MAESRQGPQHRAGVAGSPGHAPAAAPEKALEEIVLTLDSATHAVVKIARLDARGHRHELSEADSAELAGTALVDDLVHALDEAFQAGLAEGLNAEGDVEDVDDDVLMRLLVSPSAEREVRALGPRAMLLRPLLRRRWLRHRITPAPTPEQQRRTKPIPEAPRNGSTSTL